MENILDTLILMNKNILGKEKFQKNLLINFMLIDTHRALATLHSANMGHSMRTNWYDLWEMTGLSSKKKKNKAEKTMANWWKVNAFMILLPSLWSIIQNGSKDYVNIFKRWRRRKKNNHIQIHTNLHTKYT